MKKYRNTDLGLLLVRLALAAVFITHGWLKITAMGATVNFFSGALGLPVFFAYLVAAIEFLGGLAMLLGVCVECAGVLLALVMIGAMVLVKFNNGFIGGWEFDLTLLLATLSVAVSGAGKYALKIKRLG